MKRNVEIVKLLVQKTKDCSIDWTVTTSDKWDEPEPEKEIWEGTVQFTFSRSHLRACFTAQYNSWPKSPDHPPDKAQLEVRFSPGERHWEGQRVVHFVESPLRDLLPLWTCLVPLVLAAENSVIVALKQLDLVVE